MKILRKLIEAFGVGLLALGWSSVTLVAATGSWNGIGFTALNGVAQTSWNGTGISCVSSGTGLLVGLSAYYALAESSSSDNALDSSGNGYTATVNGIPGVGTGGPTGHYRTFNGLDQWFSISNAVFHPNTSVFSVCGWFNEATTTSSFPALAGMTDITGGQLEYFAILNNTGGSGSIDLNAQISTNGTSAAATAAMGTSLSTGAWHFWALVWDGTDLKGSIDGAAFSSTASAHPFNGSGAFYIGTLNAVFKYEGRQAGIGVWIGRALTITEVNTAMTTPFASW